MIDVDERATPFIRRLCNEYNVHVSIRFSYTVPHKVGNWIHLPAHYHDERLNWSFCHELSHILLNHDENSFPSNQEEEEANLLASELILPKCHFQSVSHLRLTELKSIFYHCSYEVLLRRKSQFQVGVATIIDEGRITFRNGHPSLRYPLFPTHEEWKIICKTARYGNHLFTVMDSFRLESVYLERNGFRRVLLWTEPTTDFFIS
ncbi:MAG: ImmA/IrrE family metallo-endopeptidase [bacterium]|nr:ImmA/IrrE family metallo-endopeptidase [bacterium]